MIENLYNDIKDMHIKLEHIQDERNEAINKYEDNERYWKGKFTIVEKDNT